MKHYVSKLWPGPANDNRSIGKAGQVENAPDTASPVSTNSLSDERERSGDDRGTRQAARDEPLPQAGRQERDEQGSC
jgi:hypothetical protein